MAPTDSTPPPAPASQFGGGVIPPSTVAPAAGDNTSLSASAVPPITLSSPVESGAGGVEEWEEGNEAPATVPLSAAQRADAAAAKFEEDLQNILDGVHERANFFVSHFSEKVDKASAEIVKIVEDLRDPTLPARLGQLEMAVASHAAPAISHIAHDGHDILNSWFNGIRDKFQTVVAGVAAFRADEAKKAAAEAAAKS